jgi:hypothetical protein
VGSVAFRAQPIGEVPSGLGLSLNLPAPRTPEGSHAQIEEDRDHNGRYPERAMIRPVGVAEPRAPDGRRKNNRRQQEEYAGDLKPQNAAHAAKRAQKTTDAGAQPLARPHGCLCRGSCRWSGSIYRDSLWLCNCLISCGLRPSREPLAGDASCDAKPDAESPADGLRSHPVYDGSSVHANPCFERLPAEYGLLTGGVGSKVERSCAAF